MLRAADLACRELALTQHGVFHRDQALARGHNLHSVRRRLQARAWTAIYPNVYSFAGTPQTWEFRMSAATLWSGGAAAGISAGRLFDLPNCAGAGIEVMTHRRRPCPHSDVVVHFTKRLPAAQVTVAGGIRTTCIERTLMSLAACWPRRKVAVALDDAFRRALTDAQRVDEFLRLTARRGRPGVRCLRDLARQRAQAAQMPTSALESLFMQMVFDHDLPLPRQQAPIHAPDGRHIRTVDFFYPPDLVIEAQSKAWHTGLFAEQYDTDWQNALTREGYRVLLVTYEHLTIRRAETASLILKMLPDDVLCA